MYLGSIVEMSEPPTVYDDDSWHSVKNGCGSFQLVLVMMTLPRSFIVCGVFFDLSRKFLGEKNLPLSTDGLGGG